MSATPNERGRWTATTVVLIALLVYGVVRGVIGLGQYAGLWDVG